MRFLAAAIVTPLLLSACGQASPPPESAFQSADQACTSAFNARNGHVGTLRAGASEIVWAELQAAMAASDDDRYEDLHRQSLAVKGLLVKADDKTIRQPGEFDTTAVTEAIERVAQECVRLEDEGLVP